MDSRRMARALGRRGGRARARHLTAAERRRIAALGAQARCRSLEMARRFEDHFHYLALVLAAQPPPAVERVKAFSGSLPGLYPGRP